MRGRPSGLNAEANARGGNMLSDVLKSNNADEAAANMSTSNAKHDMQKQK